MASKWYSLCCVFSLIMVATFLIPFGAVKLILPNKETAIDYISGNQVFYLGNTSSCYLQGINKNTRAICYSSIYTSECALTCSGSFSFGFILVTIGSSILFLLLVLTVYICIEDLINRRFRLNRIQVVMMPMMPVVHEGNNVNNNINNNITHHPVQPIVPVEGVDSLSNVCVGTNERAHVLVIHP